MQVSRIEAYDRLLNARVTQAPAPTPPVAPLRTPEGGSNATSTPAKASDDPKAEPTGPTVLTRKGGVEASTMARSGEVHQAVAATGTGQMANGYYERYAEAQSDSYYRVQFAISPGIHQQITGTLNITVQEGQNPSANIAAAVNQYSRVMLESAALIAHVVERSA